MNEKTNVYGGFQVFMPTKLAQAIAWAYGRRVIPVIVIQPSGRVMNYYPPMNKIMALDSVERVQEAAENR